MSKRNVHEWDRYPMVGHIRARGQNVIEHIYGKHSGVRCTRAYVVVTGNAVVKINGRIMNPVSSSGNIETYNICSYCLVGTSDHLPGGIVSLTVEGDATYYAMCSLYDTPRKKKPFQPSHLDGYDL